MDSERWEKLQTLFLAALERDPDDQAAFLDQACQGDLDLRRELEIMLGSHERSQALTIEHRLLIDEPVEMPDPHTLLDTRIGTYRLKQLIGQGGMGEVYLALRDDEQYRQQVALKLVRPGFHTADMVLRFRTERQILARLVHPNIARLLDGGMTDDGRPYLVMQYIEGAPITQFCDAHRLSVEERLPLFRKVCAAVQFAHRNLVVHRDLKPSNILVTETGEVKLLDFGIAKLLDPEVLEVSVVQTRSEFRVMTPEYAAPEQVRGEVVTTATDVYALGILLYELLTGHRPYQLPGRLQAEIERIICTEEPTRPSTAISKTEKVRKQDGTTETVNPEGVSAARRAAVGRLRRLLQGDLDNIVMMALRKEPARRYASAEQLAEDILRYLEGHPVLAQKDTVGYRMRKFVRRHQVGVAAAALVIVSLLLGIVGTTWQARVATAERDRTRLEAEKAEQVATFMAEVFKVADPTFSRGDDISARELLDRGVVRMGIELADQPAVQSQMMHVIGEVYLNLALYEQADSLLTRSLALRRQLFGEEHPDVAATRVVLGTVYHQRGQYRTADSLVQLGLDQQRRLLGETHPATAHTMSYLADVRADEGDLASAESLHREALGVLRAHFGPVHADVARVMNNLGVTLRHRDHFEEAERLLREALTIRRTLFGDRHTAVAASMSSLADLLREQGRYTEADSLYRKTLAVQRRLYGNEHPEVAATLNNLAGNSADLGDYEAAALLYEETIAIAGKVYGKDNTHTAQYLNNLAALYLYQEDFVAAKTIFEELIPLFVRLVGEHHPYTADARNNLSYALSYLDDLEGSERELRQVLAIERVLYGEEHTDVATTMASLSTLLWDMRRPTDAAAMAREALAMRRRLLPPSHADLANSLYSLASMVIDRAPEEAEPLLREAADIRRVAFSENDWRTAQAEGRLGDCLRRLGRYAEAEGLLRRSYEVAKAQRGPNHWVTKMQLDYLIDFYRALKRPDQAVHYQALRKGAQAPSDQP